MAAKKIQVADSMGSGLIQAEVGDCGAKWDPETGRFACGHVHIEEERFEAIKGGFEAMDKSIFGVSAGRSVTKNDRFGARDAQEALFFLISQLAYTEAGLFERYYQPMQNKEFIPQDYSAGEWADVIRYEIYDRVGQAKFINPASDDVPTVDIFYADATMNVNHVGIGYEYTTQELRATAFLRRPISERKIAAAIEAYERKISELGLIGDTPSNITGFLNNTSISHAVSPSGLAWSASSGITPIQLLGDFNFGLYQVYANSSFNVIPDKVALPPAAWQYITSTPAAGTTGTFVETLETFLKKANFAKALGVDVDIKPCFDATTQGASGATRSVYYRKSDQDLVQHVPMPLRFLAPELRGLKVKVTGEARAAGTILRRVPSFYYQDGN